MEWLISTSLYNALGVGAAAYALAQLGFAAWASKVARLRVEWASRAAQLRKQVEGLTDDVVRLTDQNYELRTQRNDQLKRRCQILSDDLEKFLGGWEREDLANREAMSQYRQQFSGEVVSVINDMKHFTAVSKNLDPHETMQA
jgi:hypothetical protein